MQFGIPNQRKVREEKYPNTAVMTLNVAGDKGTARSMVFNPKACELLGLPEIDAVVAFSFQDGIFVLDGGQVGVPVEHTIKVTKNAPRRISDKKTYEYISKVLELDNSVENEFKLETLNQDRVDGQPLVFKLDLMSDVIETDMVKSEVEDVNFETQGDAGISEILQQDQSFAEDKDFSIEDEAQAQYEEAKEVTDSMIQ